MKYGAEMGSGAMIYIPNFIKDWFRDSKVDLGDTLTHRQHGNLIHLLSFFSKIRKPD
jgi:hypothetical protein